MKQRVRSSASHGSKYGKQNHSTLLPGTFLRAVPTRLTARSCSETNEKVDQNTTDIAANTTNITQNSTAIENLNTSVSDINTSITGLTDNALLWDEELSRLSAQTTVESTSKITQCRRRELSEDSTDAVNGSQLYETNQKVDQNTSAIADINTSITQPWYRCTELG